ncbi:hypothetical protein [Kordiimonas sp.]|uniref:hypothetical protein n=1 Tax=Kordiimonas sp. TaxID=1970157 RepID=UPI003A93017B
MSKDEPALSAKQVSIILQFLQRTQLQGTEVPAFIDVFNSLSAAAKTGEAAPHVTTQSSTLLAREGNAP